MKLLSFQVPNDGKERFGVLSDRGIIDLSDKLPFRSLLELVSGNGLEEARQIASRTGADYGIDAVTFLPPIVAPEKIWCIGVNYPDRNAEYKDGKDALKYPSLFARNPRSVVGHLVALERPRASEQLDYEGEIVLVIGRQAKNLTRDNALDAILGVTLCNEGTIRDWLYHGKFNVTQGKNFDRSGSIGPWIVTADAIDLSAPLLLETKVNGELRQTDSSDRLIFSFVDLLVYLSSFATLSPGDMIVTGTPTGAGARLDPPVWLKPGDRIDVSVPEIGTLTNFVIDAGDLV